MTLFQFSLVLSIFNISSANADLVIQPKVVGGREVLAGSNEAPWMLALSICNRFGFCQVCGASLVSATAVLTAAHCINPNTTDYIDVYRGEVF